MAEAAPMICFLRWRVKSAARGCWCYERLGPLEGLSLSVYQSQTLPALLRSGLQLAAYKQTQTVEQACLCATGTAIKDCFHRTTQESTVLLDLWLWSLKYFGYRLWTRCAFLLCTSLDCSWCSIFVYLLVQVCEKCVYSLSLGVKSL